MKHQIDEKLKQGIEYVSDFNVTYFLPIKFTEINIIEIFLFDWLLIGELLVLKL